MEAFADGVFAIAFTLPVVEIVLPDPEGPTSHLGADLLELWPSYLGYLLASAVIGLHWLITTSPALSTAPRDTGS
ncbi:MAG: hypothetical protein AVDCRST_MAG62-879 [uncultured Sphingomonas sp.]|uniref:DUF1211 domain-containing protein n=1 Tax=uncultured Sphingomonas sp. TaxID=158754 RepID=A0A6J4T9V7_9SPHN|nr:MAG: hypothetical protein AVDCRST_MAG62-879 [uncultured Sphingomonas sp.]